MRYTIDNLKRSFLSNVVKHIAMIPAFITCLAATIFITGAAQAQDVSATIVNVQRFASGSQPTQLLATVTLEDVLIDGRRLGRQRVTFSLTGTQRDVQLAIGVHEGDTVERIDAQVTPVSLSVSGLKTFYISYLNQSALGRFTSTLTDSDRQIVFSICKFLTVRRNISSILQMLMTENNQPKPPNYIPTRMFFEASTFNVLISELVFIANRCVDEITSPIINRTVDTSSTVRPATPQAVSEVVDSSILAAVPSLNDAIRDIQSLINNSVSLEVHNELQAQLQAVQQELAALRRSTVPRSQYEQLQASTVSRQVHDRLSQQLRNVQNEIAALRESTVSTEEHTRVQRQLADAEDEIRRLLEQTVPLSDYLNLQNRIGNLEGDRNQVAHTNTLSESSDTSTIIVLNEGFNFSEFLQIAKWRVDGFSSCGDIETDGTYISYTPQDIIWSFGGELSQVGENSDRYLFIDEENKTFDFTYVTYIDAISNLPTGRVRYEGRLLENGDLLVITTSRIMDILANTSPPTYNVTTEEFIHKNCESIDKQKIDENFISPTGIGIIYGDLPISMEEYAGADCDLVIDTTKNEVTNAMVGFLAQVDGGWHAQAIVTESCASSFDSAMCESFSESTLFIPQNQVSYSSNDREIYVFTTEIEGQQCEFVQEITLRDGWGSSVMDTSDCYRNSERSRSVAIQCQ